MSRLTVAIPSMAILFATTKREGGRGLRARVADFEHIVLKINIVSAASCSNNSSVTTANG